MFGGHKPFNMDALTLERINDKLDKSNDAAIEGNHIARFRALITVYISTIFKYDEEEIKIINTAINEINAIFSHQAAEGMRVNAQFLQEKITILEGRINDFDIELNKLLYKYDVINLKKLKKASFDEEINDDYT